MKNNVNIYVLRGLFGFLFKDAMYPIAKHLKKNMGYENVQMLSWQPQYQVNIIREIESKYKKDSDNKFCLIGMSLGGNAVTAMSQVLAKKDIPLHYLAVIDAPMPVEVGKSTIVCDNFYQFNDWRDPILEIKSKKTKLSQFNFRNKEDGIGKFIKPENHISIASNEFLMKRIYDQVSKL